MPSVCFRSVTNGIVSLENRTHAGNSFFEKIPIFRWEGKVGLIANVPFAAPWNLRKTGRLAGHCPAKIRFFWILLTNRSANPVIGSTLIAS
jgi:hypothetical protein